MKIIDCFSGIGGFSYAAHMHGWETIAFVEIDKFCQSILKKNFPNIPIHEDIRKFGKKNIEEAHTIDLVCGGFPCQPYSKSGRRRGENDDRDQWPQMLRVVKEFRPRWFIGENVPGITSLAKPCSGSYLASEEIAIQESDYYIETIRNDLKREGYNVQIFNLPLSAVEGSSERQRIWFIAHTNCHDAWQDGISKENGQGRQATIRKEEQGRTQPSILNTGQDCLGLDNGSFAARREFKRFFSLNGWATLPKPGIPRNNDGLSFRVEGRGYTHRKYLELRCKAIGNSVSPALVYEIFKIVKAVDSRLFP